MVSVFSCKVPALLRRFATNDRVFHIQGNVFPILVQKVGVKTWEPEKPLENIEIPGPGRGKLPIMEQIPFTVTSTRPPKMMKRLQHIRGPELIHNKLIHGQYGITALSGAQLRHGHIEMIRNSINRRIDDTKHFAVWRIDPLWKPVTRKGQGQRMGGGKGPIDHYVTPVKAGRVIVELAGYLTKEEAFGILEDVAEKLPCSAMVVSKEILEDLKKEEMELEKANINPFSFQRLVENNMQGCHTWIRKYDKEWFDKYI